MPIIGGRRAGVRGLGFQGAGKPNEVTGLTATDVGTGRAYNNGAIDLSWTAPATNGAPITGYFIERSTDNSTWSTVVSSTGTSATTYQNTGLSSAQLYYYRVSAINAVGTGSASSSANATATTVPQAPTIGTAGSPGNTSISVPYTAGASGGKTVTTYTVTSSPSSITATGSSPVTVTGLSSGTSYTFTVTATNANGTSSASSASNSVTTTNTYSLYATYNTSTNFTVPAGVSKIGAYLVSGGRPGNNGSSSTSSVNGGNGGNGGGAMAFKDYAVNPGDTYAITVGGSGGLSAVGNFAQMAYNAAINSPANAVTVLGGSGGNGGGSGTAGGPGGNTNAISISATGMPASVQFGGAGGGGGGGVYDANLNPQRSGGAGGAGGNSGGNGGAGANVSYGTMNSGQQGGTGGAGGGGGGGGGRIYLAYNQTSSSPGNGGNGGNGQVSLYIF